MVKDSIYTRTELLLGEDAVEKLKTSKVLIAGLGGVGSYAAEAVARSGVGHLTLIDKDTVDITNINRQLYALNSTVGMDKAFLAKERCLDINPDAEITAMKENISTHLMMATE